MWLHVVFFHWNILINIQEGSIKKTPGCLNPLTRAEIIELAIAAEEAESQAQFVQVMGQLEGITTIGLLIFQIARDRIADARIRYGRHSRAYQNWLACYKTRYAATVKELPKSQESHQRRKQ